MKQITIKIRKSTYDKIVCFTATRMMAEKRNISMAEAIDDIASKVCDKEMDRLLKSDKTVNGVLSELLND